MEEHRILITGSNGLLGQKLVHLLRNKEDVELLATSLDENRISEQVGYEYAALDITDLDAIMKLVSEFNPTAIINTAAMTQVDLCEDLREECRLINVGAVGYIAAAAKANDAHLIQLSTDFVFDGENGPYREGDNPNPLSFYGQSKYDAEKVVENAGLNHWSIARTIILYGVAEKMSRSNLILWAMDALQKGEKMRVVNDQHRSPTLAEDLAIGCWNIVQTKNTGVYHLSGPEVKSIFEIVLNIADHFGWSAENVEPVMTSDLAQKAQRPPSTGFILDKAQADLEYKPKTLSEGLDIIASQLKSKAVS